MTIASEVVKIVANEAFLSEVRRVAAKLRTALEALSALYPEVFPEVRGEGLLLGLRCGPPVAEVAAAARANGMLSAAAAENVLRLLPPLIITDAEIEEAFTCLNRVGIALTARPGREGENA